MDQIQPSESQPQSNTIPPRYKSVQARKSHGNRFSVANKLAIKALKDSGMSEHQAQPIAGVSRSTITRIWNDPELDDLSPQVVSKVKTGMQGLFYKRGLQGLLAMTPEKYSEASLLQIATTVGIMTEKGRLMDGLSTDNVSFKSVSQSLDDDRAKIMERIASLEGDKT